MVKFGFGWAVAPEVMDAVLVVERCGNELGYSISRVFLGPAEYLKLIRGEEQILVSIDFNPYGGLHLSLYPKEGEVPGSMLAAFAGEGLRTIAYRMDGGLNYRSEYSYLFGVSPSPMVLWHRESKFKNQKAASALLMRFSELAAIPLVQVMLPDNVMEVVPDPTLFERSDIICVMTTVEIVERNAGESTAAFIQRAYRRAYNINHQPKEPIAVGDKVRVVRRSNFWRDQEGEVVEVSPWGHNVVILFVRIGRQEVAIDATAVEVIRP